MIKVQILIFKDRTGFHLPCDFINGIGSRVWSRRRTTRLRQLPKVDFSLARGSCSSVIEDVELRRRRPPRCRACCTTNLGRLTCTADTSIDIPCRKRRRSMCCLGTSVADGKPLPTAADATRNCWPTVLGIGFLLLCVQNALGILPPVWGNVRAAQRDGLRHLRRFVGEEGMGSNCIKRRPKIKGRVKKKEGKVRESAWRRIGMKEWNGGLLEEQTSWKNPPLLRVGLEHGGDEVLGIVCDGNAVRELVLVG